MRKRGQRPLGILSIFFVFATASNKSKFNNSDDAILYAKKLYFSKNFTSLWLKREKKGSIFFFEQ